MKLREKFKRFWTMDVHNHEGFTLVELIIVIAILAILSGVAVAGYSSYIKKANMQADKTLIAEINNTIELAYYSEQNFQPGVIILSMTEAPDVGGNAFLQAALESAYGSSWTQLRLKYNWENNITSDFADAFINSNFYGNEDALLSEVSRLTAVLSGALDSLAGGSFNAFLEDMELEGADDQTKANAAVLYTASLEVDEDAFNKAFDDFYADLAAGQGPDMMGLMGDVSKATGGSNLGACAAIYAQAEAFCQYAAANGHPELLTNFHEETANIDTSSTGAASGAVLTAFGNVITAGSKLDCSAAYVAGGYKNDVAAYLASMQAINKNTDAFEDRLSQDDCFSSNEAVALLKGFIEAAAANIQDGEVAVVVTLDSNGMLLITNIPTDK